MSKGVAVKPMANNSDDNQPATASAGAATLAGLPATSGTSATSGTPVSSQSGPTLAQPGGGAIQLIHDVRRSGWLSAGEEGPEPLDRRSPVPLYVQIRRRLLNLIASWPDPAKRFYTDDELCQQFGVARMTVRAAIREFVDEGLLTRVRGAGTFVAFEKVDEHFNPRMDFIDQWATRGRPLALDIRRLETVPAPAPFATALGIAAGAPVLFVERLRSTGPVPVSIDYRYILPDAGKHITEAAARERSLLELLARAVDLDHADMTIEAGVAEGATGETLELMRGDPVLLRGLVYTDTGGRVVMAGISFYRPDQTAYSIRVPLAGLTSSPVDNPGLGGNEDDKSEWGRLVHIRQEIRGT